MSIRHLLPCVLATAALGTSTLSAAADLEAVKQRGTLRVAVANEIPYGYMDMSGQAKGVGPEVAQQIAKALGIQKIEWVPTSFSALIPGLQADRFDVVAAEMAILPQRCQQVLFSEPNTSYGEGLMVAAGNPKGLHRYEDFKQDGLKVAIMAGADQLDILQKLGVKPDAMVTIANNADAISTVTTGRADAYAATSLTVGQLIDKSKKVDAAADFKDPVVNGQPVRSWGGFTFANNTEALRDAFNQELARFKQTDAWKQIVTDHGFSPEDREQSFATTTQALCAAS
ncbi:MAG: ectoine/hydroxyectoine ABC transporter substrate-binding protein EhuB [Pigmentiphaga sp.]